MINQDRELLNSDVDLVGNGLVYEMHSVWIVVKRKVTTILPSLIIAGARPMEQNLSLVGECLLCQI